MGVGPPHKVTLVGDEGNGVALAGGWDENNSNFIHAFKSTYCYENDILLLLYLGGDDENTISILEGSKPKTALEAPFLLASQAKAEPKFIHLCAIFIDNFYPFVF
jgi:hypothetical protein